MSHAEMVMRVLGRWLMRRGFQPDDIKLYHPPYKATIEYGAVGVVDDVVGLLEEYEVSFERASPSATLLVVSLEFPYSIIQEVDPDFLADINKHNPVGGNGADVKPGKEMSMEGIQDLAETLGVVSLKPGPNPDEDRYQFTLSASPVDEVAIAKLAKELLKRDVKFDMAAPRSTKGKISGRFLILKPGKDVHGVIERRGMNPRVVSTVEETIASVLGEEIPQPPSPPPPPPPPPQPKHEDQQPPPPPAEPEKITELIDLLKGRIIPNSPALAKWIVEEIDRAGMMVVKRTDAFIQIPGNDDTPVSIRPKEVEPDEVIRLLEQAINSIAS